MQFPFCMCDVTKHLLPLASQTRNHDQRYFQDIKMTEHSLRIKSVFDLNLNEDFMDAVIKVQDLEIKVHKVCLNCIPYFRSLFTRSPPEQRVYELSFLSAEIMRVIIDYIYTCSLAITESNVQELLEAVEFMNYVELIEACSNFLITQLSPDNCIDIWRLTFTTFLPRLRSAAFGYIQEHLEEVALYDDSSRRELFRRLSSDGFPTRQWKIRGTPMSFCSQPSV
ncbi:kelch-like protein 10 isoform X1 [Nothobranchius furzeri]|uniref:Transcript variant X1 n=2 Tax=Nothobranchius furzeri TaxID=105023 RepID=A0A9D2YYT2_NOTFU|nr:transcript variant X1 [Nothobranchius furzeri]